MRALLVVVALSGCAGRWTPPAPTPARADTEVAASFDRTWDAVIDVFARRSIPIATIDRSSGLIVSARLAVDRRDAVLWSDCGAPGGYEGPGNERFRAYASLGDFNVLVRPRGDGAIVRVTIRYAGPEPAGATRFACTSTGVYERDLEDRIRAAAERRP